jgi:large subunit ribosomal protein L30
MSTKNDKIKITQIGSPVGRNRDQRATLVGLRLNKIGRHVELFATPEVLGQVKVVSHLIRVEKI